MNQPTWSKDITTYIDSIVYGDVEIRPISVVRNHKRTVMIQTTANETIAYEDNDQALKQQLAFLMNLCSDKFNGKLTLSFEFKNGMITLIGYESTKQTPYTHEQRRQKTTR